MRHVSAGWNVLAAAFALQAADPTGPTSVERVRKRLERPVALNITLPLEPVPQFRIVIQEHPFWRDEPPTSLFEVPPMVRLVPPMATGVAARGAAAGGGIDPAALFTGVRHAIAARAARKEVEQALAAFCAEHDCSR